MTTLSLDIGGWSADEVAELYSSYLEIGDRAPEEEYDYSGLTVDQEAALRILEEVELDGHQRDLEWGRLLRRAAESGRPVGRDDARAIVTSDPDRRAHALRGLKQAVERAEAEAGWGGEAVYVPIYDDKYSGVKEITVDGGFASQLVEALERQQ